ncbi:DUF3667 domain-containing protein [Phenylobacterium sp.]|jgi:hypothetical protein|uniref:DUF3667 domain-containing protein n=1 Tax=Phenylobacterium sp. TaxID=1871053 RepID=UPI002F952F1D
MVDVEAVGAAATAGLASKVIERPTGHAGQPHHLCADCRAEVTGRFCANCGQPAHVHRSLLHLGEELLHGVMHFDGRIWRTLPLLVFRPGQLTREWVQGRRARYVSPLAMFLFTVFVMFVGLSYLPGAPEHSETGQQLSAGAELARRSTEVALAEQALERATPAERPAAEARLKAAEAEMEKVSKVVGNVRIATPDTVQASVGKDERYDWQEALGERARTGQVDLNLGNDKLEKKIAKKLQNPALFFYKLQQSFYKFSFLLVPISIPFVALLFLWKRGFTLYDHGVFVLYSLTFMSMLVMAVVIAMRIGDWASITAWTVATFAVPVHMYFQLKGAYSLNWFSAAWRTWVLLWFCTFALTLFGLAVIYLGLL